MTKQTGLLWPQERYATKWHVPLQALAKGHVLNQAQVRHRWLKNTDEVLICVESHPSDIQRCSFSDWIIHLNHLSSHHDQLTRYSVEMSSTLQTTHNYSQENAGFKAWTLLWFITLPSSELEWYLAYIVSRFSKRLNKEPHMFLGWRMGEISTSCPGSDH